MLCNVKKRFTPNRPAADLFLGWRFDKKSCSIREVAEVKVVGEGRSDAIGNLCRSGETLVRSGFFSYVSNLSNLPVVVFLLILFVDFTVDAKRPKYF
jgi:hypothetical protein